MKVHRFDHSPGNGTRYRLVVVLDSRNNLVCIAWPDHRWSCGDLGQTVSAEWLQYSGGLRFPHPSPAADKSGGGPMAPTAPHT